MRPFLTGEHHVFFPAVDNFHGNPLLMLFLEHDVREMRDAIGVTATYCRNRIREAFSDRARVADTEATVDAVYIVFPRFVSTLTQTPTVRQLLPLEPMEVHGSTLEFIIEPNVPRYFPTAVKNASITFCLSSRDGDAR